LPFKHVQYIGQGGSAVIEKVAHKSTNDIFALKTFRRYNARQFERAISAFRNEVSITKRLSSHTHMIQIQGTYVCDRQLIMALSPVANGGDLASYLTEALESGIEREQEIVLNRAFGCLANGLAHIHKHTIRHKDIKPQNILIHDGRVVYTDFGLSFDADQQDTTTVGYPGACTRRYCAPEVQDWANRNRKSDVWSLGCVFVEILDVL
ncbi:kinase-like protein, partial [Lophiostoma macrostomum CBS 122681]